MIRKDNILEVLKSELKIDPLNVHNIYLYGSHVYGVATKDSDYDFTIIADNYIDDIEHAVSFNGIEYNFHIQTPDYFQERLDYNDPKAIECLLWSKRNPILENKQFSFEIVKHKYRHAVSQISSNSWVKAKKKLEVEKEDYIGQKSLFHSLRIPMYATQVLKHGEIIDWGCSNEYWDDIMTTNDWNTLKDKYKKIHNGIMSQFRELCPKENII